MKPIGVDQPEPPDSLIEVFDSLAAQGVPAHRARFAMSGFNLQRGDSYRLKNESVDKAFELYYADGLAACPDAKRLTQHAAYHLVQDEYPVHCPIAFCPTWAPVQTVYGGEHWGAACCVPRSPYYEMLLDADRHGEYKPSCTMRSLIGMASAACESISGASVMNTWSFDMENMTDGGGAAHNVERLDGDASPALQRALIRSWTQRFLMPLWASGVPAAAAQGGIERDTIKAELEEVPSQSPARHARTIPTVQPHRPPRRACLTCACPLRPQDGYTLCNVNEALAKSWGRHFGRPPLLPASGDGAFGMLAGGGIFWADSGTDHKPSGWVALGASIGYAECACPVRRDAPMPFGSSALAVAPHPADDWHLALRVVQALPEEPAGHARRLPGRQL